MYDGEFQGTITSDAMKITRLETIPINVPLVPDLTTKTAHGEHVVSPYVIVRVHTDAGLVGLGEATLAPRWSGETSPGCVAVIDGLIAPLLVGEDPTQIDSLRPKIEGCIRWNPFTKAAVEMALWDLAGKAAGVPVCELLGGSQEDDIPIKMVVGAFEIPKAVALVKRFLDDGAKCLKVKVGLDPEQDIERVRAVRQLAGPQIPIGVDANGGWDFVTARRMLGSLEEFDLLFVEQPIPPGDPLAMAELRSASPTPIMADESVFTITDAQGLARHSSVDILGCYPGKHGGIAATLEIAQVARNAGIVCCLGSNLELGIGTAAMLHVVAACSVFDNQTYPADLIGPLYHQADMLVEPLLLGPATAKVPRGPGLGVELDEQQLERYRDRSTVAQPMD